MEDETGAIQVHVHWPEFTLAEVVELEILHKKMREKTINLEFCEEISAKFNSSANRSASCHVMPEQVQSWLQEKRTGLVTSIAQSSASKESAKSKAAFVKRAKGDSYLEMMQKICLFASDHVPTVSASEAAAQLQNLIFEARSAKDDAWFDVASFLTYRILNSGELVVRVRFAGFGKEEDEWVSVKNAIRERSIPLEPSECTRVNVGDLVLCFREFDNHALYCDAHVIEIERKSHKSNQCTCIFVVHYDKDNFEEKIPMEKLCYRPIELPSAGVMECKPKVLELDALQIAPFVG